MTEPDTSHERIRDGACERSGRPMPTPSNVVDLGTDVGAEPPTGLPRAEFGAGQPPPAVRDDWEVVEETGRGPGGGSRPGAAEDPPGVGEYVARTYRAPDALAVVAELPGVSEAALSTGIDVRSNRFVVSVEGRTIDRIPLPWPSTVVAAVGFEDGVLEARLEPDEDGGLGAVGEGCV